MVELLNGRQELYRIGEEMIQSGKFPWQPLQQSGKTYFIWNIIRIVVVLYKFVFKYRSTNDTS